ncbi:MAG: bifunctional methylenetetrahydrofolate dehydrogenase/methenyltetrahydrofolate cyclohydrolase FolD [Acidobacteria bacterium]|nr:bifunctional methylenetetrahydrofolate dehydrogenase/methenyltetrahydrofolate cyclohydrolase FolD [Acidobacteriota bacterium]
MPAQLLSGKPIAEAIKAEVKDEIAGLGYTPGLTVVRVGEDPASAVYVGSKVRTAVEVGIRSEEIHLDETVSQEELLRHVDSLNERDDVDGILVQLPLPKHINEQTILEHIDPTKDVDGFHPVNAGRLMQAHPALAPCTPAGVIEILKRSNIPITGANAVVVGRSNIVGKPMAMLLLNENATVTVCHSKTRDLADVCSRADILVAAIGRPGFIRSEHIKEGATVIDVGINSVSDRDMLPNFFEGEELQKRYAAIDKRGATLVGDVAWRDAVEKAAYFTPVPGGVGLLTVAMLMKNTVAAARMRRKINHIET